MKHKHLVLASFPKPDLTSTVCGLLLFILIAASPARATELVLLDGEDQPITQLIVGTDLNVAVLGAPPGAEYQVRLRNDYNLTVAWADVKIDGNGASSPTTLWKRTGTTGCTPCSDPDPRFHIYETFEDAEADLDGRKLVADLVDPGTQTVIDTRSIKAVVDPERPLIFPADENGCPYFDRLRRENVHLIMRGLPTAVSEVRIFVIEKTDGPTTYLHDLRGPDYRNGQVVAISPSSQLPIYDELIWEKPDDTCETRLVVRFSYGGAQSSDSVALEPGDTVLEGPMLTSDSDKPRSGGGRHPEDDDECEVCDQCQVC